LIDQFLDQDAVVVNDKSSPDLSLHNTIFTWSASSAMDSYRLHIEGTVSFVQGKITVIVGPTGSGKTSLLMALLGKIPLLTS
jgi:ABC-type Mn2+/Zn2+ transport system ATPase subunit